MGWQRDEGSEAGEEPVGGPGVPGNPGVSGTAGAEGGSAWSSGAVRDERLAGFAQGGKWDGRPPGPELAAVLSAVGGAGWRCPGAEPDELIGVLRRLATLESWASAAKLGVIRELIRQDDLPALSRLRHGDLPDSWSDSLNHELALALASSVPSAEKTALTAWELGARLPGIAALLADGTLTYAKARLIAETFQLLSDADAARAEALIMPQLVGATGKTFGQIINLANRAADEVDPGMAERRRKAAVKHNSRVQMYREQSGAAALCGRDLPPDEVLAANANVTARAAEYKDSGVFPDDRMDQLRSTAYLDLINGRPAHERIALGFLSTDRPDPETEAATGTATANPDDQGNPDNGGPDVENSADEGSEVGDPDGDGPDIVPPDDGGPDTDDPDDGFGGTEPFDGNGPGSGGSGNGGCDAPDDSGSGSDERDDSGIGEDDSNRGDDSDRGAHGNEPPLGNDPAGRGGGGQVPPPIRGKSSSGPVLADLVLPLATLLGLAERPGEGYRLGVLDPDLCRDLAQLAAASPHSSLCVTVTDRHGIAIGHGCGQPGKLTDASPGRRSTTAPPHPVALPARVNLTITADRLIAVLSRTFRPPGESGRPAAKGWALTRRDACGPPGSTVSTGSAVGPGSPNRSRWTGKEDPCRATGSADDPQWCGTWTLVLPGGRDLAVRIEPVPTYGCDHRHESHAYQPNATLRHLVQVRDHACTFPSCSRHARETDFEHARPYDKGGRTCSCNAGARSRKCHRIKQSTGWNVIQPQPGWHVWTTPSGRTYTQTPYRYPV